MLKPAQIGAALAATSGIAEPLQVERFGLYVLAFDMERATSFYEGLFGLSPTVRRPALSAFDVAGGLFAVVSRETYAPGVPAGGSVRPYLWVADLEAALRRAQATPGAEIEGDGIVTEGSFRFFRMTDSEGNVLELFALSSALTD